MLLSTHKPSASTKAQLTGLLQVPEDATQLHEVEGEMSIVPGQVKLGR